MKTITNNTDHVITITNGYFSKDIAINETISIPDQEINKNCVFQFGFFGIKEKSNREMKIVRTIGNRIGLWFTSVSYIPLQTEFDIGSYDKIILKNQSNEIILISKLFKKICLLSPVIESSNKKIAYKFPSSKCRKNLLLSLGIELLLTIPFFLIMLYSCFVSYLESWGWFECISLSLCTLYLAYSNTRKLYYLLSKFKNKRI